MDDQAGRIRPDNDGQDLLQPVHAPEDIDERTQTARQREERRWLEDRPPHYEPR
jgi:hypothetical protein